MIPFLDLKAQMRAIRPDIDAAVARAIGRTQFAPGPDVGAFEERFADYCRVGHCHGVDSGTSALRLALRASGIGPGDEVITVSMALAATTAAIVQSGATPVYVDVDPVTWTMDPTLIEAAITRRTRAILPVHLHGLMADMDRIMPIARRHGLVVIEDASQAHGAEHRGRRAGSIGDLGCFSFYPDKNLGAYGEAGAVVTNQPDLAGRISRLLDRKQDEKSSHVVVYNDRMDDLQAAVLNVKLDHIEAWTEARRSVAAQYDRALSDLPFARPRPPCDSRHVYHIYAVRLQRRDEGLRALQGAGIGVGIHYPVPIHLQGRYAELGYRVGDLPLTETLASEFLSLPIYPELLPDQVTAVGHVLKTVALRGAGVFRDDVAFQDRTVWRGQTA